MIYRFNSEFRFGVADADLQVIGEAHTQAQEDSAESMWMHFAKHSGKCHNNASPAEGVERFHRWREDLALMQGMGVRHYRTSVSMARTLHPDGSPNKKGIEWYRTYYSALRQAGIAVYATLYHWELPQYLNAQGGWKNRRTIDALLRHAIVVHEELGDLIEEFFVLNEPWCSSMLSYHLGIHAPGEKSIEGALRAAHHLLLGQGAVIAELTARNPAVKIGTVLNTQPAYAASNKPEDIQAARRADAYFNAWFFDPIYLGKYPEVLLEHFGDKVPQAGRGDMELMRVGPRLHALGVNYYCGDTVQADSTDDRGYRTVPFPNRLKNDLNWPVYSPPDYPEGFYDMLTQLHFSYREHGLRRMYVTENGFAQHTPWDGKSEVVDDDRRCRYFADHLRQLHKAISRGVPVEAYFLWTLMDNYEWAEGYRPESCFGIVHVDRKSMMRIKKQSALFYERVLRSNELNAA